MSEAKKGRDTTANQRQERVLENKSVSTDRNAHSISVKLSPPRYKPSHLHPMTISSHHRSTVSVTHNDDVIVLLFLLLYGDSKKPRYLWGVVIY